MADLGLDYAGNSPGAAAVKAAGYNFVARYLSRYTAKTIKKFEYDDMTGNGVGVVLVFEDYAAQALQGFAQGVSDAQVALEQANALGWPADRPIHFAVDFDINDSQKAQAGEYMKGVISVLGLARTGAYGGFYWIKYCADNGLASFFWQATAWSGGQVHPSATLFQRLGGVTVNGTSCDVNDALKDDYGQNNKTQGEVEMTQAQATELALYIRLLAFESVDEANSHSADDVQHILADPAYAGAIAKAVYSGEWQTPAYKVGHYDADTKALQDQLTAYQNKPVPTPEPQPPVVPTPDPSPLVPQPSFFDWLKSIFGKK
jgi:hypothetical protein